MKKYNKRLNGFMLVEALICLAVISIFLTYFLIFSNNIYKNDAISLEKSDSLFVAKEIIEKSSALGKLVVNNNDKYDVDTTLIFETKRRIDYKISIKNKNNNQVDVYEFSIDKRKKN